MVIDSHAHIEGDKFTVKDLLASMNEAGIDFSILIADSASLGNKGITTDQVVRIGEGNPRLKPIGNVEYRNLDADHIQTLVNYLKHGKIYGVKLYPGYEDFYPADEKLFPLYEQCQNLGKPVIFHTGLLAQELPGKLKQSHPLNTDEVAQRFPKLKIVMAHFGNPWVIDGTMVAWRNKNVYVDLSGYFGQKIPKAHMRFFKYDLRILSSWLQGFHKCLFGSDYPIASQDEYLKVVKQLPLLSEERDLVLWKNAKNIFGL